jgi:RimJ/RimL family protein N-acetyltransferase
VNGALGGRGVLQSCRSPFEQTYGLCCAQGSHVAVMRGATHGVRARIATMDHRPPSRIALESPRLQLRWPTERDIDALAECAVYGIGEPGYYMPFWTDGDPEAVARSVVQQIWAASGAWQPHDWTLHLAVLHDGEVVGCQTLGAKDFSSLREGLVTAWFDRRHQGRGFGTESRAAVLELAFAGLGAEDALSVVRQDNARSLRVARRLGFSDDGVQHNVVRGRRVRCQRLRLTRACWEATVDRPEIRITGLDRCAELFGISADAAAPQAGPDPILAVELSGIRYATGSDETLD